MWLRAWWKGAVPLVEPAAADVAASIPTVSPLPWRLTVFCLECSAPKITPVSLLGVYRTSALMSLIQRLWPANHSDITLPNSLMVLRSYEASWLTVCLLHLEQKLHNHRDLPCLVLSLLYPKSLEQSKYDTEKLSKKYLLKWMNCSTFRNQKPRKNSTGNLSFLNVDSKLKHRKHTTAPKPTIRAKSNTPGNGVLCTPDSARYSIKATASLGIEAGMKGSGVRRKSCFVSLLRSLGCCACAEFWLLSY